MAGLNGTRQYPALTTESVTEMARLIAALEDACTELGGAKVEGRLAQSILQKHMASDVPPDVGRLGMAAVLNLANSTARYVKASEALCNWMLVHLPPVDVDALEREGLL